MMNLKHATSALAAIALATVMSSCDNSTPPAGTLDLGGAVLKSVEYGRLVDVYAYRRIDRTRADRRDTRNRKPALIRENVVIRPDVQTQNLFDSAGESRTDADYRFCRSMSRSATKSS